MVYAKPCLLLALALVSAPRFAADAPAPAAAPKFKVTQWLKAAGKNGIPCAFVVSKGKVNWIGHPGRFNKELLPSILDGKLDVAALAKAAAAGEAAGK